MKKHLEPVLKESGTQTKDLPLIPQIIPVGGGKGGVGKTIITSSMAMGLAMLRQDVIVIDADLGGANLHSVLGIEKPDVSCLNYFKREVKTLEEVLIPHPHHHNLRMASGAVGSFGMANLSFSQKAKLIRHISQFRSDFILIDLGAGTSFNVLDFFLTSNRGIVVVTPDTLSILDGYNFIRQVFYRKLMLLFKDHPDAKTLINECAQAETHKPLMSIKELRRRLTTFSKEQNRRIDQFVSNFKPRLLINQIKDQADETHGQAVMIAAKDLLSIDMEYLGAIHRDEAVPRSLEEHSPFIYQNPDSIASKDLMKIISTTILHPDATKHMDQPKAAKKETKSVAVEKKQTSIRVREKVICSVGCQYWEDCEFRNGGFPCDLVGL
jgi:flagellar biosynthesis protein FlhG